MKKIEAIVRKTKFEEVKEAVWIFMNMENLPITKPETWAQFVDICALSKYIRGRSLGDGSFQFISYQTFFIAKM